jgi:hypothetical protein
VVILDLVVLRKYLETANINNMEDLKIFGLNVGALLFSTMPNLNPALQTIVLVLTIIYTTLMIIKKFKE